MGSLDRRQFLGAIAKPAAAASMIVSSPTLMANAYSKIKKVSGDPKSIAKDDSIEVDIAWTVPDEDKDFLTLTYNIEAKQFNQEDMLQCDSCDDSVSDGKDNDEYTETLPVVLPAVLGEIEAINYLTERELIKGVPLLYPALAGIGLVLAMVAIPILMRRRGGGSSNSRPSDDQESDDEKT